MPWISHCRPTLSPISTELRFASSTLKIKPLARIAGRQRSASSIIAANGRGPISTMAACRGMNGKQLLRKSEKSGRRSGAFAVCDPEALRGQGWLQSLDGRDPRTFRIAKGLGLHNDLQNEHSIVGNLPLVTMLDRYGRDDQKAMIEGSITGKYRITFGLDRARAWLGCHAHGNPRGARRPATAFRDG